MLYLYIFMRLRSAACIFQSGYVYGIIPRAMVLIAVAAIFTMLCERTAGMLSNLMNAEEQEQMLQNIKAMHKKSQETSGILMNMVQELKERKVIS